MRKLIEKLSFYSVITKQLYVEVFSVYAYWKDHNCILYDIVYT